MNNWKYCSGVALRGSPVLRQGTAVKGRDVGGCDNKSVCKSFFTVKIQWDLGYMYIFLSSMLHFKLCYIISSMYADLVLLSSPRHLPLNCCLSCCPHSLSTPH